MIDYIKGRVAELTPTYAVIDCGGVGYEINITLIDNAELQGKTEAKLYVHEAIREDAHVLFGFLSKQTREYFRLLIGVSGVGPNTARLILSAMTSDQLASSIAAGDSKALKTVKGIGGKTAERIIIDLKDKIKGSAESFIGSIPATPSGYDDALAALQMLGFAVPASRKVLDRLFRAEPGLSVESAIKKALTML